MQQAVLSRAAQDPWAHICLLRVVTILVDPHLVRVRLPGKNLPVGMSKLLQQAPLAAVCTGAALQYWFA